jgi:hypothetical protein
LISIELYIMCWEWDAALPSYLKLRFVARLFASVDSSFFISLVFIYQDSYLEICGRDGLSSKYDKLVFMLIIYMCSFC